MAFLCFKPSVIYSCAVAVYLLLTYLNGGDSNANWFNAFNVFSHIILEKFICTKYGIQWKQRQAKSLKIE